jgi:hypothetical protein
MIIADGEQEASTSADPVPVVGSFRNSGEPLHFTNVQPLAGFAAEAAKDGQQVKIWTKLAITSDEALFHRLVGHFVNVINYMAQKDGIGVNLLKAATVLLVLKPDATAELWLDTAAVSIRCIAKRAIEAGTVVFEQDLADITGMNFPCVTFGPADKLLCLFRADWRFGFAFDMNPEGDLDVEGFTKTLGSLYREMRYKHLYDAMNEPAVFDNLLTAGWFPFVEIITAEFRELLEHCEAGFNIGEIEASILAKFDDLRMQRILERWLNKPHFAARGELLNAAICAFLKREPIAVIKILLTEIEGVLNDAHRAVHDGQGAKLKGLLEFAEVSAQRKAGGSNSLLFPKAFSRYLREHTFAAFDPISQSGTAASRHAVGHGAASQDSYTMLRALQAILTLDQLAFYT